MAGVRDRVYLQILLRTCERPKGAAMRVVVTLISMVALALGLFAGGASSASSSTAMRTQDRCVRGQWRMSNAAANALLQSLVGSSSMRVSEGVITAAFPRNERMRYASTHFVVTLSAGSLTLKGSATFFFEAGWQTGSGKLILDAGRSELYISKFTATQNGKTVSMAGPAPTRRRIDGGASPYTCRGNTLRWKIPLNDTWTLFHRVD
jgi:hypothetical protein